MQQLLREVRCRLAESKQPYSLVLLDVDFFIRYCLRFPAPVCERMIAAMEHFLCQAFGPKAWLERSAGDEWAVILPNLSAAEGLRLTEQVRCTFRRQRFTQDLPGAYHSCRLSFSAGLAAYPEDADDAETIVCQAVTALYVAKAQRRNQVFHVHWQVAEQHLVRRRAPPKTGRVLYAPQALVRVVTGSPGDIGPTRQPVAREKGRLWEPQALAVDEAGRLYIADQDSHQILCCDAQTLFSVAGNGTFGYAGDGGPPLAAQLNKPTGIGYHRGRLYIADTGNDVVRVLSPDRSRIDTVAGRGSPGYTGDGGPAQRALLNKPGGVAEDRDGNLYIDDIANNVVRCVASDGKIHRCAGTGTFGYGGDGGSARDACFQEIYGIGCNYTGDCLYLADYGNHRIRRVHLPSGRIDTVAGCGQPGYTGDGGNPHQACLCHPVAVCEDREGNLYIADAGNSAVRIVTDAGTRIFTLVGGLGIGTGQPGPARTFALANPNGVAAYGGELFLLDGANNRVCALHL